VMYQGNCAGVLYYTGPVLGGDVVWVRDARRSGGGPGQAHILRPPGPDAVPGVQRGVPGVFLTWYLYYCIQVRFSGVMWFGFETPDAVVGGIGQEDILRPLGPDAISGVQHDPPALCGETLLASTFPADGTHRCQPRPQGEGHPWYSPVTPTGSCWHTLGTPLVYLWHTLNTPVATPGIPLAHLWQQDMCTVQPSQRRRQLQHQYHPRVLQPIMCVTLCSSLCFVTASRA